MMQIKLTDKQGLHSFHEDLFYTEHGTNFSIYLCVYAFHEHLKEQWTTNRVLSVENNYLFLNGNTNTAGFTPLN